MVVFFSFDFEKRGENYTVNGPNGLGIVVIDENGVELECYETGIAPSNGRCFDPDTKKNFWDFNPEALKWLQDHQESPQVVVSKIVALWMKYTQLYKKVVWVAWPASADWSVLNPFYNEFKAENAPNIGFKAECASSMYKCYAAEKGLPPKGDCADVGFPIVNPHFPGSDARAQGLAFVVIARYFKLDYN